MAYWTSITGNFSFLFGVSQLHCHLPSVCSIWHVQWPSKHSLMVRFRPFSAETSSNANKSFYKVVLLLCVGFLAFVLGSQGTCLWVSVRKSSFWKLNEICIFNTLISHQGFPKTTVKKCNKSIMTLGLILNMYLCNTGRRCIEPYDRKVIMFGHLSGDR